jgi:hypothetical protein
MLVPSVATMKLIALPDPSSSLGRTDTGMPVVSDFPGRASFSSRKRRKAPEQSASTTSFNVQSAAVATARMRSSENCCVAKRRFSRTRPLSAERGESKGMARPSSLLPIRLTNLAKAMTSFGTV